MARIYTKTGDDGTTGLIDGSRVSKASLRIESYGVVDELNAVIGAVRSNVPPQRVDLILGRVQDDLFTVGANLASPKDGPAEWRVPALGDETIHALELDIDACEGALRPLNRFIIPGGSPAAAMLHVARTVARRAERCCVKLARSEKVDPLIIQYLNRLSDLLFVLARFVNQQESRPESHPTFGKTG